MKVLKKKMKKVSKIQKIFYYLSILLYGGSLAYFIYGILHLSGIENTLRIIIVAFFSIWFIIYILCGLITMLSKKTKTFIFITFITILLSPVFIVSSYYINKVYGSLDSMVHEKIVYTTNLITMKENEFTSDSVIGMIETESDIEGNQLAKKLIEEKNLTNEIRYYTDYVEMITDMYSGEIDACFVSSNYAVNFQNEEFDDSDTTIGDRVKVVYELSEEMANQDIATIGTNTDKKLTEPFTMLIMGVDSTTDGLKANQAFNGDTLILVTFNPNTLTATMFSIPRDMYVPIACNNNRYAKINSSAAYGSSCVISTVEQLTDIEIDYYLKMNFKGVVDLVDALGGVTVDVEEPDYTYNKSIYCGEHTVCEQNSLRQFGNEMIYIKTGTQTLDGEQALAYARNRHQYAQSDIARNQHQQQIIEAIANKVKEVKSLSAFQDILDAITNNLETNMTPEQILSFYSVGKDMLTNTNASELSIKKTYLSYYSLNVYLPRYGRYTSALGYYQESLDAIVEAMKVNLDLETETPTKTYSISYNEDYESPIIGKGLYGGSKLALMESFIGKERYLASNYCSTNGLSCVFETVQNSAPAGQITDQSVHVGVLVKSITSTVTFYVSDGSGTTTTTDPVENTDDNTDNEDNQTDNTDTNTDTDNENNTDSENNNNNTNTDVDETVPGTELEEENQTNT